MGYMKKFADICRILLAGLLILSPLSTFFFEINLAPFAESIREKVDSVDQIFYQFGVNLEAGRYGDRLVEYVSKLDLGLQKVEADAVDLYWVGGTATWDGTAGTKWATSSGGAGGHAVPTSTNKVIFDSFSSANTITIALSGPTSSDLTFAGTGAGAFAGHIGVNGIVNVYGSLELVAGMIFDGQLPTFTYRSTAVGKTITTAGKTLFSETFDGVGGGWTFQDAHSWSNTFSLVNGSVYTNTQTVNGYLFSSSNANIRTWDMTSSVMSVNQWEVTTATNLTLTTTGSTLNVGTSSIGFFYGGGKTYIAVALTAYGSATAVTGANAYTNLTITNPAAGGAVSFAATQTVSGTLTITGTDNNTKRLFVYSSVGGTQRTLSAGVVAVTNSAMSDMIGSGAGNWNISAGDNVDNGNNTNITFTTSQTTNLYWVGNGGAWTDVAHWSTVSGGAGGHASPNSSTINVFIDSNSITSGSQVITGTNITPAVKDFTMTPAFSTFVYWNSALGGGLYIYGNFVIGAGNSIGFAVNNGIFFQGTGNVTTNGVDIQSSLNVRFYGTYTLLDTLNSSNSVLVYGGTLNTNGQTVNAYTMSTSGATVKTINLGASNINLQTAWSIAGSNDTINPGTSTITQGLINTYVYSTNYTFDGGGFTYYNVIMKVAGVNNNDIMGTNTFTNLSILGQPFTTVQAKPWVRLAVDQVITGTLTVTGDNAVGHRIRLESTVIGTPRQITLSNNAVVSNTDFRDIAGTPSSKWNLSATNAGDMGGNYGITFAALLNVYWVGNSGSWSDVNHWALTSGGTGGTGRVPLVGLDVAIFDGNSVTYGPGAVTITMNVPDISSIDASTVLYTPIFSGTPVNVYGDLDLGTVTWSVTNTYFMSAIPSFIRSTSNLQNIIISTSSMGVCYLGSDITSTGSITLSSGLFDLNGHNLAASTFDSSTTTYSRQILLGEGSFTLNSTAAVTKWNVASTNLILTKESGTIILTNSGANAQTFAGGGMTYGNVQIQGAGNYSLSITGANTFASLIIYRSEAAKTVKFPTSVTTTVSNLYIPVSGTTVVTLVGTTAPPTASVWTISKASGVVITDYLSIEDSTAIGGAVFYGGSHSTFVSHVTGWLNSDPTTPYVSTDSATLVASNSATLNGTLLSIYPVSVGYAYFQYGLTTSYGGNTPEIQMLGIGSFSCSLTGLDYSTTYHYKAAFRYSGATYTYGADVEFTTQAAPAGYPDINTLEATNVASTTATLQGSIVSLGTYSPIYVFFEYGPTSYYGTETTEITETVITSFSTPVTGLTDDTTYYFRAVARFNVNSYVYGVGRTFYHSSISSFPSRVQAEVPPTVLPAPMLDLFENPPAGMSGWPGHPSMSRAAASMGWDEPILYSIFFIIIALVVGLAATVAVNTLWGFIIGFGSTMGAFTSTGIGAPWVNYLVIGVAVLLGFLWRNN